MDQENSSEENLIDSSLLDSVNAEALSGELEENIENSEEAVENEEVLMDKLDSIDEELILFNEWLEESKIEESEISAIVESLLFVSDKPISISKLKSIIDERIPLKKLLEAVERLQEQYETSLHGIRLVEIADGYQFRSKTKYSNYVQKVYKGNTFTLSGTALEVLAIIAYRGPVSRIEIEKIRGVDSSHIIRLLIDKRLVKTAGRSEEMGRPVNYAVTDDFLELFGLNSLEDLPPDYELEAMLSKSQVGAISDLKEIVGRSENKIFNLDEIDELDQLHDSIKSAQAETMFTKSLKKEDKKKKSNEDALSAFDLLEEFLLKNDLDEENKKASVSETLIDAGEPKIVSDLFQLNLNAPDEEVLNDEEAIEEGSEDMLFNEGQNLEQEKLDLAKELDDAFFKMTGEKLDEVEISSEDMENLELAENEVNRIVENIANNSNELDEKIAEENKE